MSTWTTNGIPAVAGDPFGDHQVGDAYTLTYTTTRRLNERVSVTFGVIFTEAKRYSGEIVVEHEVFKDGDWDNAPGNVPTPEKDYFLQDHPSIAGARRDSEEAIRHWKGLSFTDAELNVSPT